MKLIEATPQAIASNSTFGSPLLLGFCIKEDGTRVYAQRYNSLAVYQYDLTTPYALTPNTANGTGSISVTRQVSSTIKDDGTVFYVLHNNSDFVYEYDITTAFDISSGLTLTGNSTIVLGGVSADIKFIENGTGLIVTRSDTNEINQYSLTTPWTTQDGMSLVHSFTVAYDPFGVDIDEVNRKMYVLDNTNKRIKEYDIN